MEALTTCLSSSISRSIPPPLSYVISLDLIILYLLYCGSYFLHSLPSLPFRIFRITSLRSNFLPPFPVSLHPSFVYFSFLSFIPLFFPSFRCGHCKKLAPEFEKAASRLKGSVQLAKVMCPSCSLLLWTPVSQQSYLFVSPVRQVDCTTNSETCSRFGVSGYPTLRIFRYGKDSAPYDGPRTAGRKHYEHPNPALLLDSVM